MNRVFTLEEAQSLMPRVKAITHPAFELAASMAQELQDLESQDEAERTEALRKRLQEVITAWTDTIREMGMDVKGLWLVDFDSGDGYWSWSYPEEELLYWHSYDEGYAGRVPVEVRVSRCK